MQRLALFIIMACLVACGGTPTRYHIIDTPALDKDLAFKAPAERQYALRETALPDYLKAQYLIYRNENGETIIDKTQLWGQKFPDNLRRVLGNMLGERLGSNHVYVYPLSNNLRPERIIDVQIGEMIADYRQKAVIFRSKWQISTPGESNPPSYSHNRDYPLTGLDADSIIATYRQILIDLSAAIVPTL